MIINILTGSSIDSGTQAPAIPLSAELLIHIRIEKLNSYVKRSETPFRAGALVASKVVNIMRLFLRLFLNSY